MYKKLDTKIARAPKIGALLAYCQETTSGESKVVDVVYHGECAFQSATLKDLIADAKAELLLLKRSGKP